MVDAFPTILLLRFVHITVASVAVGATLAFRFWLRLARREPEHLAFVIRGIRWIDRWVAEPAYFFAFATGVAMVLWGVSSFTAGWLLVSLVLYAAITVLGLTVFGPVVRKQLAALERGGVTDPEFLRRERQSARLGAVTIAGLLAILALMVLKPF